MNIKNNWALLPKLALAFFVVLSNFVFAQKDSIREIEVVKIIKITSKNKTELNTKDTPFLNQNAGAFLNSIPDINLIKKSASYAFDPVLRGFKNEQLNVVIDGALSVVNACPSRMDPPISQVNMSIVKDAEIYKGPYFLRKGPAFGGTINFNTIPPKFSDTLKFGGRFSSGYETNGNIVRNEVLGRLMSRKIVWDIFGSYQKGDDYKDGNGNEAPSSFLRYNIGTKLNYQWNSNHISSFQINTNQGRDIDFASLNMNLIYDKTWTFQATHQAKFNKEHLKEFNFNAYTGLVKHSMGNTAKTMISNVESQSYGARGELKYQFGKHYFYTGLDFKQDHAKSLDFIMPAMMKPRDGTSWQNSHINNYGWFNEFQYFFNKSKITASLRLDYNESDALDPSQFFKTYYEKLDGKDFNASFSLGWNHEINKNWQWAFWLGRAQRSGSITEKYINRFAVGLDAYELIGNPNLKPETNNQADLIFTFQKTDFHFQTDFFYSYLQNYISGVVVNVMPYSMTAPGTRQFQNIDKAFKTGAEASINWEFSPKYKTGMAVAYTYAENSATKNPLPEIAPLDFRWNIEANFSTIVLGLNYRFAAKQNRISPDFGEIKTPDFSVLDFTAKYNIFKNFYLNASVLNIFNRAYAEYLNRTLSTDKHQRILAPGRNFVFSVNYSF